jgi:hypothetical protein
MLNWEIYFIVFSIVFYVPVVVKKNTDIIVNL